MNQAVIVCGGLGTRLSAEDINVPKCLIDIGGKSVLQHQIESLSTAGYTQALLLLGSQAVKITDYLVSMPVPLGFEIAVRRESVRLGTGGAIVNALDLLDDRFLVIYGDIFVDLDFSQIARSLDEGIELSILTRPSNHMFDSNLVTMDVYGLVTNFKMKPHGEHAVLRNRAITGIYAVRRSCITALSEKFTANFDFDSEGLPYLLSEGFRIGQTANPGIVCDIGTSDRILLAREILSKQDGKKFRPTIYLDRDGVINRPAGHISDPESFEIYPDVPKAIYDLRVIGYRVVVVTNQPGIARGDFTWEQLEALHAQLDKVLESNNTYVDQIYVCPHHPDKGYQGEISEFKIACDCRKPKPGMILRAISDFPTKADESWMVGDSIADKGAADQAGVHFAAIDREMNSKVWRDLDAEVFTNLSEFVNFLRRKSSEG